MKFKKLLAFILSLCIIFGMAAIGVSAVDPVSSDSDTVILCLNSGEALEIYSDCYEIRNADTGDILQAANFTGAYILTGEIDFIFLYTSCDITFHNLKISARYGAIALYFSDDSENITVNLTAKGTNSITSSGSYAIAYNMDVNLTVENNSSITLKGGSDCGYIYSDSTLAMADGSALPPVSADGSLTVSNGTPAVHTLTFTALTGGKHKFSCSCGDLEYTVNCLSFNGTAVNDDVCKKVCKDCGDIQNVEHDYVAFAYDYNTNGHEVKCRYCSKKRPSLTPIIKATIDARTKTTVSRNAMNATMWIWRTVLCRIHLPSLFPMATAGTAMSASTAE